ncbi:hypothetical protein CHS0354_017462 [Potamilus streckersoni]|uniref:Steroid 21-hydroxylase n=1 Tax=Potamilus streckersoni TaxID=2493646 RepID=A0AAE0RXZ3_9BIVA|nr:hypothetical protein CHS0354_017462 [Potamilus streckersoni]
MVLDQLLSERMVKTGLVGLIAGLAVYWLMHWRKTRKFPPGPLSLPIIGHFYLFKSTLLHEQIYEWTKKYGPVVSVAVGPFKFVMVNDIDTVQEVLVKKSTDFANRISSYSSDLFTDGGKDIALGQYGPTWRLHRKIASKALRQYMQGEDLEKRVHIALEKGIDTLKTEKEPFDPALHITSIVFNIICALCFGESYEFEDPEFRTIIDVEDSINEKLQSGLFLEDFIPLLRYFPTKNFQQFSVLVNELKAFMKKKFDEHKYSFDEGNIRDFTDHLIQARKEAEEEGKEDILEQLTETHLIQTLLDIFQAGIDTTRLTLRFALFHMAQYPNIQEKVHKEINEAVSGGRLPGMADRVNLGYTEAVLHESMRLAPVAPTGLPHVATCATKIGDYEIPKGTMVLINFWALHHDPHQWDEVEKFKPERFLSEGNKLGPKPESWLPFSAGRRVCLGETVAKPELYLIFAGLMQRFTVKFPDGVIPDLTPKGGMIVLYPPDHKLIFEDRSLKS